MLIVTKTEVWPWWGVALVGCGLGGVWPWWGVALRGSCCWWGSVAYSDTFCLGLVVRELVIVGAHR